MSLSKTWEIWVRSVNYINVSPQVVILYYSLAKNVTIVGNWAEYKRELSELFLATVCKSTITSIKISITNSSLILQSQKNPADRSQDTSPQSSLSVLSTTSPEPCFLCSHPVPIVMLTVRFFLHFKALSCTFVCVEAEMAAHCSSSGDTCIVHITLTAQSSLAPVPHTHIPGSRQPQLLAAVSAQGPFSQLGKRTISESVEKPEGKSRETTNESLHGSPKLNALGKQAFLSVCSNWGLIYQNFPINTCLREE